MEAVQPRRRNLRVVTGICEYESCQAKARWLVRRGTKRGEAMLCCGRHLLAVCKEITQGLHGVIVTPVLHEEE